MTTVKPRTKWSKFALPKIRECCRKCKNKDKSYLVCYHNKFCGKCPNLMANSDKPPKEYQESFFSKWEKIIKSGE